MKFSDIIGQNGVKDVLRRSADSGRVSHAQLFAGAPGRGGLPLALAYVQYLNCTQRSGGDSCGRCPSCRKISQLVHPDLHFIFPTVNRKDAEGGSSKTVAGLSDNFLPRWRSTVEATGGYFDEADWYEALGIGNQQGVIPKRDADEVIRKLAFKSFEATVKAAVVWLPEKMGDGAANTLLKILEEPWADTLFLLVSADTRAILPTVLSRVQTVEVPPVDPASLESYAAALLPSDAPAAERAAAARAAARLCGGDVRVLRAIAAEQSGGAASEADEDFEAFASLMRLCYAGRHTELLEWADCMAEAGRERQKKFLTGAVGLLREAFMFGIGMPQMTGVWGERERFCRSFAPFVTERNVAALVAEMESALLHVMRNGNPRIVLAHFALSVSKLISKNN